VRRSRAERFYARGAPVLPRAVRSTRTLGGVRTSSLWLTIRENLTWKSVLTIALLVGFFGLITAVGLTRKPIEKSLEIHAAVVGSYVRTNVNATSEHYMRVQLASGQELLVEVSSGLPVLPGRAVILRRSANGSDLSPHVFVKYVEDAT